MVKEIDITKKATPEQVLMLAKAATMPFVPDDDCPEFTDEELRQFKRVSNAKAADRKKQTVTIRLSSRALKKAKSLGKGYTSVLSRILENALDNADIVRQNL